MLIGDILINMGAITRESLEKAIADKSSNSLLGDYLLSNNLITDEEYIKSLSIQSGMTTVDLSNQPVTPLLDTIFKKNFCLKHSVVPFKVDEKAVYIAISDPYNYTTVDLAKNTSGMAVIPYLASAKDIAGHTNLLYDADIKKSNSSALKIKGIELQSNTKENKTDIDSVSNDAIVSYLNTLVINARTQNTSDIHIDPRKSKVNIRFRIDGSLRDMDTIDTIFLDNLIRHIKIRSNLDVTLSRVPQDGRFTVKTSNHSELDIRVSVIPTLYGEKCVLRLLDKEKTAPTLETIGLLKSDYNKISKMLKKPHGLILVCGPTGSGKSTSSAAIIHKLTTTDKNIMTLEDPIEYILPGVNQSNIDTAAGFTFERGLRTILRQDPDIIMIGEIRDEITARMAISAATSGHLVISTLHTNDAISAVTRLRDMGIEDYHIASCLIGVVSQRLVKKLCTSCSEESKEDLALIKGKLKTAQSDINVRKNVGCSKCYEGYKGRIPLVEVLTISDILKDAIYNKDSNRELLKSALSDGYTTMNICAMKNILLGYTTVSEVEKVLGGI